MAASVDPLTIQPFQAFAAPHTPSNYVQALLLAANVAEAIAIPALARYVRLSGTVDFYASFQSSTAELVTNGAFAADASWTKGTGWTIAAGVATATGAISTALSQVIASLETGRAYRVTMTVTRSAGSITPSVGGTAGTARSTSATFTETIICGATTTLAFTGSGFTGTLDNISVTPVAIVPGDNTTGTAAELIKSGNIEWRQIGATAAISFVSAGTPIITAAFYRD